MSTPDILLQLENEERLKRFLPRGRSFEVERRRLYLTPSVYNWCMQEPKKNPMRDYHAKVYVHLSQFVFGAPINDRDYMKQCKPFANNIWEIRIRFHPACRIFGAFLKPDCFVATHMTDRKNLDFNKHVIQAMDEWQELFPNVQRLAGIRFADYVTFNGEERDERKSYGQGH